MKEINYKEMNFNPFNLIGGHKQFGEDITLGVERLEDML